MSENLRLYNGYYHWLSVITYIQTLNDEGIIEDKTAENMKEHLYKIKYFIDDELDKEIDDEILRREIQKYKESGHD